MAAKIYAAPDVVGDPPEIDYSDRDGKTWDEVLAPEREWEEQIKEWCRQFGQGKTRGEEVKWGRGDGYARYVVFTERPLALIHLATGDAWEIDDIMRRGLNLTDIRENVSRGQRLAELFSVKPIEFAEGSSDAG
jgi:hypothetical protein